MTSAAQPAQTADLEQAEVSVTRTGHAFDSGAYRLGFADHAANQYRQHLATSPGWLLSYEAGIATAAALA
jgi:hypothetical protein